MEENVRAFVAAAVVAGKGSCRLVDMRQDTERPRLRQCKLTMLNMVVGFVVGGWGGGCCWVCFNPNTI